MSVAMLSIAYWTSEIPEYHGPYGLIEEFRKGFWGQKEPPDIKNFDRLLGSISRDPTILTPDLLEQSPMMFQRYRNLPSSPAREPYVAC